jgi:transcriptional regulator with XRE-family HTH domain
LAGNAFLDPLETDGEDARASARRHLHLETVGSGSAGERANVTIHNVSATGLLIETDLALQADEVLLVDLPESGVVEARIVWRSAPMFGCKFNASLEPSILSAIQLKASVHARLPSTLKQEASATMGKQLEQLRKKRGMTLADVAGQLGVSKPTVWAWEKGKARPVESRLPEIARALDVSPDELAAMSMPPAVNDLLETSKRKIADAFGTSPEKVRIMIEL